MVKIGKINFKKLIILICLILIVLIFKNYFEVLFNDKDLSSILHHYKKFAPIIYIAVYSLAPVFFIPPSPFGLIAGVLFGSLWGIIYSLIGTVVGATICFYLAKYFLRDWIKKKIQDSKFENLYNGVKKYGWKIVAITRLIPLFPYNLLNYMFGLTEIKFTHYILASFVFSIPCCATYVIFGDSITDIVNGKFSLKFFIAIFLFLLLSISPLIYKKFKERS